LRKGDDLVGMVVADPDATLLTVCEHGYGKRTNFGPNTVAEGETGTGQRRWRLNGGGRAMAEPVAEEAVAEDADSGEETSSGTRYRTQRRGGKGIRDIKTTNATAKWSASLASTTTTNLLMMTARGKIQRIKAAEISIIGRNTQGVRIMSLDEGDTLAAVVRVAKDADEEPEVAPVVPAL
jgi:DNA gyrase subunit A